MTHARAGQFIDAVVAATAGNLSACLDPFQACQSLGYSRDELLCLHLCDIDPGYSAERLAADWVNFQVREPVSLRLETCHRRKDGMVLPVDVPAAHIWFGEDARLAGPRDAVGWPAQASVRGSNVSAVPLVQ